MLFWLSDGAMKELMFHERISFKKNQELNFFIRANWTLKKGIAKWR